MSKKSISSEDTANEARKREENRKLLLTRLAQVVAVIATIWLVYWFFFARGMVDTDNAYVGADSAQITPLVSGAVKARPVGNTSMVRKGDVLIVIDDADAQIEVANARAAYLQAVQKFKILLQRPMIRIMRVALHGRHDPVGPEKAAQVVDVPVGVVPFNALTQPEHPRHAEIVPQRLLDLAATKLRIPVPVEQA